jgi:hypothetical protein
VQMTKRDLATVVITNAYLCAFGIGVAIIGYETLHWLRYGWWYSIPIAYAFTLLSIDLSSIYQPSSWFGLMEIVALILEIPLALGLPGAIVLVAHGIEYQLKRPSQSDRSAG